MYSRRKMILGSAGLFMLPAGGCIPVGKREAKSSFEITPLDAAMVICIDMSGSYRHYWKDRAFQHLMRLMQTFFLEGGGMNYRIIIAQISGDGDVIVFDGTPQDLKTRFQDPKDLMSFLEQVSHPNGSRIYSSLDEALRYAMALSGLRESTHLLLVAMSDMADSQTDRDRLRVSGQAMLASLRAYREAGGGIALYYVALEQVPLWGRILTETGFVEGQFLISNELEEQPQLPQFD